MRNRRRWVELGKDVLIVLLTLSAIGLLTMTPLIQDSGVLNLFAAPEDPGVGSSGGGWTAAVAPTRLAITGEDGRCGIQYDEAQLEAAFPPLGALLGDALASAGELQVMPESQWREGLAGPGVYFDFEGEVPLAALERWLQGSEERALSGSARRLLLCAGEGDQVLLCWQEAGGAFYSCSTALTQELHLNPVVSEAAFNGAYFAFEDQKMGARLAPYTLITEEEHTGAGYNVSMPLTGDAVVESMVEALSFSSQNHAPVSNGEVYLDGGDRLVVGGGTVTFRAARGEKYPVGVTLADGVDGARALAEAALGALCGEARLYLISAREEPEGMRVRFGYLLAGNAVYLGSEGWAAEFLAQDGYIVQFTLRFRSYAASGERTLLLPVDKAAVMLPDLTSQRRELVIQYRDGGGTGLFPGWVAV